MTEKIGQATEMNWWVWYGYLEIPEGKQFVYALLAPTDAQLREIERNEYQIVDGCALVSYEVVVAPEVGKVMREAAAEGEVDFTMIEVSLPIIRFYAQRTTVEAALGYSAAALDAYYTLTEPSWLRNAPPGALRTLLHLLEKELGLPFSGRLAGHLGNLDVIDFGVDGPETPVAVATRRNGAGLCVEIRRRQGWAEIAMLAHFKATSGEEVLADDLVMLPIGIERVEHAIPNETSGFEVTIFDVNGGRRRYHRTGALSLGFNLNMEIKGRSVEINDALTTRMQGAGRVTSEKAKKRISFDRMRSNFDGDDARIRTHTADIRARLAADQTDSLDHFFKRTLAEEWGALDHIRKLLEDVSTTSAILVDPFFSEESLFRLLMRLGNSGLELTVVTSWATTHPDTAEELSPDRETSLNENIQRLREVANRLKGILDPKVRLINLVRGGESAFHDRYLLLRRAGMAPVVYLLSNSINGMAVNWPFCMSALVGPAAREAADYVEGLVQGKDVSGQNAIHANFDWRDDVR
ncbi:VPA1262 family N-terminal domain-containing protein [Acetobacter malorum]|uniref:VPA1262 family N-terminal domain-containing protein n=1 Tax=Acetobacter malorum TaxID=178901 RepID=UPI0039ECB024